MTPIRLADRMEFVNSDIRGPLFIEANRMEARGEKVLKLNTGNPGKFGFPMPESVRDSLLSQVERAVPYCDVQGMPEAREAICEYQQGRGFQGITPADVCIGNGVSEIASMIGSALFNPGDEVLIPTPSYSLWTNVAVIAEARPVLYRCDEANSWYPDVEDIRRKITPKTKAILVINPNNPTGAVYPTEILLDIIALAWEHDLVIISDEIYDRLVMDDLSAVSVAALAPDLPVVTCNGLSKSHIVCGFRCGWMVVSGPAAFRTSFMGAIHKLAAMRLCSNALTQLVIPAALADPGSTRSMLLPGGRLFEQREATCRALDQIPGISYVKNHAAFYLFPKIDTERFHITSDRQFALDVLHGTHVLFIPGSGFDWAAPDHFRLVMLPEAEILYDAMMRLGRFLETYRQTDHPVI